MEKNCNLLSPKKELYTKGYIPLGLERWETANETELIMQVDITEDTCDLFRLAAYTLPNVSD